MLKTLPTFSLRNIVNVFTFQVIIEEAYRNQSSYATLFTNRANFKALMYTCALVLFQQFSGINVVLFYTGDIFESTGSEMSSSTSTIIVGVVMFFAAAVCPLVVERLGRKILLIISSVGMALTLVSQNPQVWITFFSIIIFHSQFKTQ